MHVLVATVNDSMFSIIKMMLRKEAFRCNTIDIGEGDLEIEKLYHYDIILLDLMPPDIHGYQVLRRLRAAQVPTPVLILLGWGELDHNLRGLGFAADNFLTTPFNRQDLVARMRVIVSRSKGYSETVIRAGKLVVDLSARVVKVDGRPLHLTGKEYGIVELLSSRKGITLTKEMLLNHLYRGMNEPEMKIIDVFVCKLRKKLAQATGGQHYIETVWGRGYMMRNAPEPVEPIPPPTDSAISNASRYRKAALDKLEGHSIAMGPCTSPLAGVTAITT